MADYMDYRLAIWNFFESAWGARTPIAQANQDFKAPDGDWIRFTVHEALDQRSNIGSPKRRDIRGTIYVQVFTPLGKGEGQAIRHIDFLKGIFRDRRVDNVVFADIRIDQMEPETGFYGALFTVEYRVDATH